MQPTEPKVQVGPPDPSHGAVCPLHPERDAIGACERCGQFVCVDCRGGRGACISCTGPMMAAIPSSEDRARWTIRFLTLSMIADAGGAFISLLWLSGLQGGTADLFLGSLEMLVGLGVVVGIIGGAISFLRWLHLAVRQGDALGVDTGATPGWAVGWWFVPIANLYKPYGVVRRLMIGLGGEVLVRSANLSLWWTMWIITNLLGQVETRMFVQQGFTESPSMYAVSLASSLSGAAAAFLAIRVVQAAQGALDIRRGNSITRQASRPAPPGFAR